MAPACRSIAPAISGPDKPPRLTPRLPPAAGVGARHSRADHKGRHIPARHPDNAQDATPAVAPARFNGHRTLLQQLAQVQLGALSKRRLGGASRVLAYLGSVDAPDPNPLDRTAGESCAEGVAVNDRDDAHRHEIGRGRICKHQERGNDAGEGPRHFLRRPAFDAFAAGVSASVTPVSRMP